MASLAAYGNDQVQYFPVATSYDSRKLQENVHPSYFQGCSRDIKVKETRQVSCSDHWLPRYDTGYFPTAVAPRIHRNGTYAQSSVNNAKLKNGNPVYHLQPFPNPNASGLFSYSERPPVPRHCDDVYSASTPKRPKSKSRFKRWMSLNDSIMPTWEGDPGDIYQASYMSDGVAHDMYDSMKTYASPVSSSHYDYQDDPMTIQASMHNDSGLGRWQQWPWVPQSLYRSSAVSPPSPLDSGLSSQSIASSPSIEHEETMPARNHKNYDYEGIPYYQPRRDARQCNCPSNVYASNNATTHFQQWKVDSGRSSPWAPLPANQQCSVTPSQQTRAIYTNVTASPHDHGLLSHMKRSDPQRDCRQFLEPGLQESRLRDQQEHRELSHRVPISLESRHCPLSRSTSKFVSCSSRDIECTSEKLQSIQVMTDSSHVDDVSKEKETSVQSSASRVKRVPFADTSTEPKSLKQVSRKVQEENSRNAEQALFELEEIYKKLNLDDFDLLDRAERRDLPTAHQNRQEFSLSQSLTLTRSKSDSFYEILGCDYGTCYPKPQRAPPVRRSGVPDRIADDMALRKQQKAVAKSQKIVNNSSYMLSSAHFTPGIPAGINEYPFINRPDVEYDDLSYRKYFQSKIEQPQPPFGIPLKPMISGPCTDYLRVTPSAVPKALCHPRGNPDVVRDDMAYRTLRRDIL